MSKLIQFGEHVEGYSIPVLNEREIRAAAGMLFVLMFISILMAAMNRDFVLLKYAVTFFLTDISIRVFINPKFAPSLIIGRWVVNNQTPEYVGARQKQFAWYIGVTIAAIMFVHLVIVNAYSPITGILCLICLIFLFFESAFGICLGCKFYSLVYKEKAQYCPGEVCDVKSRHEIQKTSVSQALVVLAFVVGITVLAFVAKDNFNRKPYDLFGIEPTSQAR